MRAKFRCGPTVVSKKEGYSQTDTHTQRGAAALYNRYCLLQYEKLTKLIKDFEPFKNLWITVSDWQKWYDSWMNDPLTSVDAEAVEKNVSDAYKTMHKSVKLFQDIPSEYTCKLTFLL